MRRADRLFQITVLLQRRRRVITAREIASALEVSERTIYRDVQDLMLSGVPILSDAGVGYRLQPGFELPPLMFTAEELSALRLGARMVETWADASLAAAAASALRRIGAVLPAGIDPECEFPIYAPDYVPPEVKQHLKELRHAISGQFKVHLTYIRADGQISDRTVQPFGLFY